MNPNATKTPENTNNGVGKLNKLAYRDGYIHASDLEPFFQEENQSDRRNIRENNQAAGSLRFGISVAAIIGFLGYSVFLLTHHNQPTLTPMQSAPTSLTSHP